MAKRAPATRKPADTKPVKTKQPDRSPEVVEFEPYGSFGWTLKRVQWALENLERGQMGPAHELWLAMTRDPTIKHGLKLRRDTLTQVPFYHEKPEGLPQEYFDEWVAWWGRCWPRPSQGLANGYKIGMGLAPLNVTWALRDDKRYWRPSVHVKEPLCVEWYEWQRIYRFQARIGAEMPGGKVNTGDAAMLTGKSGIPGLLDMWPLTGERWLLLQEEPLRPHHHGAERSLAAGWLMGAEAMRWWSAHNRKHGMEWVGVKMPMGQRESDDCRSLMNAVVNLENAGVVPLPQALDKDKPSYGMEVFAAKTEASKTFAGLIELADAYKTLLLLGAQENTQGGSGNNAKAKTQDRVALRLTKGDCAGIIEVHDQLARTACEVNGFDPDCAPMLKCTVEVPEDQAVLAQRQEQQAAAGQAVGALITQLDASNAARGLAKQPLIVYEADYLLEQVGLMLTRAQDGEQTRPK